MQIHQFKSLNSTNDYAINQINENKLSTPFAVFALEQTSGKGRYGRTWISDVGNLYFSIAISEQNITDVIGYYSLLSTLTTASVIAELIGDLADIKIKWPNDILINNKKICGTLLEYIDKTSALVIGIGVNISTYPKDGNLLYPAACLQEFNIDIAPLDLAQKIINQFEINLSLIKDQNFKQIKKLWLDKAYNLNETITVNLPNRSIKGIFIGINDNAELILESTVANGKTTIETINFGDVFLSD